MAHLNKGRNNNESVYGLVFSLRDLSLNPEARPFSNTHAFAPVPLRSVDITTKVVDFISEVTITQTFINVETVAIETTYMYPIEEEAAVTFFEADVDGRKIITRVKEKEEAKVEYNSAINENRTAILLEEIQQDIFKIKLGQLKPGAGAKIVLKYISELPLDDSKIRLTIPTTITPRYVPSKDMSKSSQEVASITYSTQNPAPLAITIKGFMQCKMKNIHSPTHDVKLSTSKSCDSQGQYTFEGRLSAYTTDMNRDFVFLIEAEDADKMNKPVVYLEEYDIEGERKGLVGMLSLVPSFKLKEQSTELIFVVDRSGSMGWNSGIEQAKKALELFLHALPPNCYFNIYSFGSSFDAMFGEKSVPYTDDSMRRAIEQVRCMSANYGGTEIYQPLKSIFDRPACVADHLRRVFLLTDGAVSNSSMVISLVKARNQQGRIFSLGLGASASRHLVKGIARVGGGTAIFASENEDLRPKVMQQLKNAMEPIISDIKITWDGISFGDAHQIRHEPKDLFELETKRTLLGYMKPKKMARIVPEQDGPSGDAFKVIQTPSNIPPLFDGKRFLMYWDFGEFWKTRPDLKKSSEFFEQNMEKNERFPKNVTVVAESPDGPLSLDVKINESNVLEGGDFVKKLAARKMIQELEEEEEFDEHGASNYQSSEENRRRKNMIVKLGIENSLASSQTSFVGVDAKTKMSLFQEPMVQRPIPTNAPIFSSNLMNLHSFPNSLNCSVNSATAATSASYSQG